MLLNLTGTMLELELDWDKNDHSLDYGEPMLLEPDPAELEVHYLSPDSIYSYPKRMKDYDHKLKFFQSRAYAYEVSHTSGRLKTSVMVRVPVPTHPIGKHADEDGMGRGNHPSKLVRFENWFRESARHHLTLSPSICWDEIDKKSMAYLSSSLRLIVTDQIFSALLESWCREIDFHGRQPHCSRTPQWWAGWHPYHFYTVEKSPDGQHRLKAPMVPQRYVKDTDRRSTSPLPLP